MLQNVLSITITSAQETAILAKADELLALLDAFAISLTQEQRDNLFKLGDGRLPFDGKCDTFLHQNPGLVPPGFSLTEYDKDGAALAAVRRIGAKVGVIAERLRDTQTALGSDRIVGDLAFYNFLDFGTRTGLPGADDIRATLKDTLFPPGGSGSGTPPTPPPTP